MSLTTGPRLVLPLSIFIALTAAWFSDDRGVRVAAQSVNASREIDAAEIPTLHLQLGHVMPVFALTLSSTAEMLASADLSGQIVLWNLKHRAEAKTFQPLDGMERGGYADVVMDGRARWIAAAARGDGVVTVIDVATGRRLASLPTGAGVGKLAFNRDGTQLAGVTRRGDAAVWDTGRWQLLPQFAEPAAKPAVEDFLLDPWGNLAITFSADGQTLTLARTDGAVETWDIASARAVRRADVGRGVIAIVSPDGRVAAGFDYQNIRIAGLSNPGDTAVEAFESHAVRKMAFCPDASRIAVAEVGDQSVITVMDTRDRPSRTRITVDGQITSLAFHACQQMTVGLFDGSIAQIDLASPVPPTGYRRLGHRADPLRDVFLDDAFVLRLSTDAGLYVWRLPDDRLSLTQVWSAGESGARFTASGDVVLRTPDSTLLLDARGSHRTASAMAMASVPVISDDGRRVALLEYEKSTVVDVASGERLVEGTHSHAGYGGAFDSTGRWCAATALSGDVLLLDVQQKQSRLLKGHGATVNALLFASRDGVLWSADTAGQIRRWSLADGTSTIVRAADGISTLALALTTDRTRLAAGRDDGSILVLDARSGAVADRLTGHRGPVLGLRYNARGWLVSRSQDAARLWGPRAHQRLTMVLLPDQHWAVAADGGRFDTDIIESLDRLRWVFKDDPLRPLPVEMYLRDYYEPRLASRTITGETFEARPIASLNRARPLVDIERVVWADEREGLATVHVRVTAAKEDFLRPGQTAPWTSDAYDLRVFRDGQLVGSRPEGGDAWRLNRALSEGTDENTDDRPSWRDATHLPDTATGAVCFELPVRVPRNLGLSEVTFSAYAFNRDRVKSETDTETVPIPEAMTRRRGVAYVITFGVNRTQGSRDWDLQYAVNDARAMSTALGEHLPSAKERFDKFAEVRLVSPAGQGEALAAKANLKLVLDRLAGRPVDSARLHAIPGAANFEAARPEDLVVIAVSSHGFTDSRGIFHLLPYDIGRHATRLTPAVRTRMVSSDELSVWLRDVDAGELVLIVDACYSEATVSADGFKPGPMGSRGLGQLTYDKGMRVLAASRAAEPAQERGGSIKQGLLTYALVRMGLERLAADFQPPNGSILLGEWLAYGVETVPALARDGDPRGGLTREASRRASRLRGYQQPVLFDFARTTHDLVLVSGGRAEEKTSVRSGDR